MRQWKSLVALHASAPSCFPQPPREEGEKEEQQQQHKDDGEKQQQKEEVVRVVGCDGRVRAYRPPVTARDLMQQQPCHLVCRADALLIGEKIPAVAPGEELQPGQAYFLLPAHMFRSALSFVSLASSMLRLLSSSAGTKQQRQKMVRPFELRRTASGKLQLKFSDHLLAMEEEKEEEKEKKLRPAVLQGDERLEKEYEGLVGYRKSRRWAPKLEPIQEVVATTPATEEQAASSSSSPTSSAVQRRKSRGLPFLGRLGSRRRRDSRSSCSAVACSG